MPAAKLVMVETAATRSRKKRPRITSGTVDMPTASAPSDAGDADLGRRLEGRAGEPHVDAGRERDAFALGGAEQGGAEARVIGAGHADEALVGRLADQRVDAGEVDVVGDQHQFAGTDLGAQRAGGIGEDQRVAAERLRASRSAPASPPASPRLVVMGAAGEDDDRHALEPAGDHLAAVGGDAGGRESRAARR